MRPRPSVTPDTAFFWEGCADGELRIQRCSGCHVLRHPPEPSCAECGSPAWDWIVASGTGTVHSWVVVHEPAFAGIELPYVVALVDLAEGTRMISNVVDVDPGELRVGTEVRLRITDTGGGVFLPLFTAP